MGTDRSRKPEAARRRIPLPPLPPLPGGPEAARTGEPGAAVLNELVDEIEKDLDAANGRHDPAEGLPAYRRVVGCAHVAPGEEGP